jgi:hypothetical protein
MPNDQQMREAYEKGLAEYERNERETDGRELPTSERYGYREGFYDGFQAALSTRPQPAITPEMVERGAKAISNRHTSNTGVPFPAEACRDDAAACLQAAIGGDDAE